ncbi:hypothetical protein [Streptomyces atratus]
MRSLSYADAGLCSPMSATTRLTGTVGLDDLLARFLQPQAA